MARLSAVRGFAKHHRAYDPRTEIPECPFPHRRVRQPPHIYSDAEIASLLALARQLKDHTLSATYSTLFALLAATDAALRTKLDGLHIAQRLLNEYEELWRGRVERMSALINETKEIAQ